MKKLILPFFFFLAFLAQGQTSDTTAIRIEVDSLIELNRSLIGALKYEEALQTIRQAEEKCLETFGEENPLFAKIEYYAGVTFYLLGRYSEAMPFMVKSKEIREKTIGKLHPDYANSVNTIGTLYWMMGNYEKTEPFWLEAKQVREQVHGKEHPDYAGSLNNLAILYSKMGHYDKAEPLYLQAKAITEKALGKENASYARDLNNLAGLYLDLGDYEKAEALYLETKAITEKVYGKDHPSHAPSLENLALLYYKTGNYGKAEQLWMEEKTLIENALGKDHPKYAKSLKNLAKMYKEMGNYDKAELFYLESKSLREKFFGQESLDYAATLNHLALLYTDMGSYEKAESLFMKVKAIYGEKIGREHRNYALNLNSLADLYVKMEHYEKAGQLMMESNALLQKTLGKDHPDYALRLNHFGNLYLETGDYESAEALFLESNSILEKTLGKSHPEYTKSLGNLGNLYWKLGNYEKARNLLVEADEIEKALLKNAIRYLSENELLKYTVKFTTRQSKFFSFAQVRGGLSRPAYNNTLFYKGFLLNANRQLARLAQTDSTSRAMFHTLKTYNRRLAVEYSKPVRERKNVPELEEKGNAIEKRLARSLSGFDNVLQQVSWEEVQEQLRPGAAAVEFVHYPFSNPEHTDSVMYAAIVLKKSGPPRFIPLFEEKSLDSLFALHQERRADYVNDLYAIAERGAVSVNKPGKTLYDIIWQPIEQELKDVETIYFSPSGLLHYLNLGAIAMDDERTVGDMHNLIQFNSTRTLALGEQEYVFNDEAVLYGGIQYESDSTAIALANQHYSDHSLASRGAPHFKLRDTTTRGGKWNYLKWTKKEVDAIHPILEAGDFNASIYTDYAATEEAFRRIGQEGPSPRILHLATHGFFFPDPENTSPQHSGEIVFKSSDHPMIRTGLILAGGNHVWQGNAPMEHMEDGILTAYEISQMDLSGTELVVLSACETGLGEIAGSEGVYGLQRAFKAAGVRYLIMSLWQVPDRQTKDFMVHFYRHWLEGKTTIPSAFRRAQKEMKQVFSNPYFWAGFVLVE